MNVVLSAEAENDLEATANYIARDNPVRAISFLSELREKCRTLGDLPRGYPMVAGYHGQVRRRMHGNYAIFYQVAGETITVIHVLHGARDYAAILFPD